MSRVLDLHGRRTVGELILARNQFASAALILQKRNVIKHSIVSIGFCNELYEQLPTYTAYSILQPPLLSEALTCFTALGAKVSRGTRHLPTPLYSVRTAARIPVIHAAVRCRTVVPAAAVFEPLREPQSHSLISDLWLLSIPAPVV